MAQAMARRHDWRVVVPRIRRVYDEAVGAAINRTS
jgi:hypothetical protein